VGRPAHPWASCFRWRGCKHITGSLLCVSIHFCKRVTHLDELQAALRRTILEAQIIGRVVTASVDKTARIWDAENGKEIAALKGHDGPVRIAARSGASDERIRACSSQGART
jgi:WD40 repeat protein